MIELSQKDKLKKGAETMNSKELKVEMMRHNENGEDLAKVLGISRQTLSNKMNETNNAVFTQREIAAIINHYSLACERAFEIFFALKMS